MYECENCGTRNIKCSNCNKNIDVSVENNEIVFKCPDCNFELDA